MRSASIEKKFAMLGLTLAEVVDMFRPVDTSEGPPYQIGLGENQWPSTPRNFREVSEVYIDAMVSLGTEVVRAIALALDVKESLFTSRIDKAFWNLRTVAYKARNFDTIDLNAVGMGEHTGDLLSLH